MKLNRIEERKVDEFIRRYRAKPEPIDNSRLVAGSPMYFYCKACGAYITSLPEGYLTVPPRYCEACEDLKTLALLDEALRRAQVMNAT
jgi:hypothetical protein